MRRFSGSSTRTKTKHTDDDGALLGQLSMLRARMFVEGHDDREWHEAVSYAVSAH